MARKAKKPRQTTSEQDESPTSQNLSAHSQSQSATVKKRSLPLDYPDGPTKSAKRQKQHPSEPALRSTSTLHVDQPPAIWKHSHQQADGKHTSNSKLSQDSSKPNLSNQVAKQAVDNAQLKPSSSPPEPSLPTEVHQLIAKYEFTSMHIISSSKMQQKIRHILELISHSAAADGCSKPGVVLLYADAAVANKMISIVEIVKKEVEKTHGSWYQYTKLGSRVAKSKPDIRIHVRGGRKSNRNGRQSEPEHCKVKDNDADTVVSVATEPTKSEEVRSISSGNENEDAFETMTAPQHEEAAVARFTEKTVPIMSIYIARAPISKLKDVYG